METDGSEKDARLRRLMVSAQEGDSAAYNKLLSELAPLLAGLIRRRRAFLAKDDIEDLVQDVLLSVHAVRATYDPDRPFLPWLFAIAHNRMADSARRQIRVKDNEVGVDEYPETFSGSATNIVNEAYGDPEALRAAVNRLPAGQRRAIELLKLGEMSLKEASQRSGMSVAALKVAVHRGVKALRAVLKRQGNE